MTLILNYIVYFCSEQIIETFEVHCFLPNLSKISNLLVKHYNIHIINLFLPNLIYMYLNLYVYSMTTFFKFQYDASNHYPRKDQLLWIDMPWYSRLLHIIKQIPCYILLFLFPFFSSCCPWSRDVSILICILINSKSRNFFIFSVR